MPGVSYHVAELTARSYTTACRPSAGALVHKPCVAGMTIRTRLVKLSVMIWAGPAGCRVGVVRPLRPEKAEGAESALEVARVLAYVVDRELALREATLRALAVSPCAAQGRSCGFYEMAKAVAPSPDTAVVLTSLDGHQLLNTRRPHGSALPGTSQLGRLRAAASPTVTLVSDLTLSRCGKI